MKSAKEIIIEKALENNGGFLTGQIKWIVEAMEEYACQFKPKQEEVPSLGQLFKNMDEIKERFFDG